MWSEYLGEGWQPATVRTVGILRAEKTKVIVVFESGRQAVATRTPPYLRPRDRLKRGRDKPKPVWRERF